MARLSKKTRSRIDKAVLLCAARLKGDKNQFRNLHSVRPDRFAAVMCKRMLSTGDIMVLLEPEDFREQPHSEQIARIDAAIRRLVRRRLLVREDLSVPVLQGQWSGGTKIVNRKMPCYWPTSILDELSRC